MGTDAALRPLSGVRVVDITVALAGPLCTQLLAGLGAEVIKIEPPGGDDLARWNPPYAGRSGIHLHEPAVGDVAVSLINRTRGKQSVTLNLRTQRGRQLLLDLVACSQVFVENRSAGVPGRLGLDYGSLRAVNPALVYCSLQGVGLDSEFADVRIMDILIQALSGIMDVTGEADGPPMRVGIPIGDMCGALMAVSGILGALRMSEMSGVGQHLQVNLVDSLASLMAMEHFDALAAAGVPTRSGNSHSRLTPFGVYPCADGHIAIVAFRDDWFAALAAAMGRPDLLADERFRGRPDRVRHAPDLDAVISAWTSPLTVREALGKLHADADAGVPAAPVRTVSEVLADTSLRRSGAIVPLAHPDPEVGVSLTGSGLPWQFSQAEADLPATAPDLGADTERVLTTLLGLGPAELADLRRRQVI